MKRNKMEWDGMGCDILDWTGIKWDEMEWNEWIFPTRHNRRLGQKQI